MSELEPQHVSKVKDIVYEKYPEMEDVEPSVSTKKVQEESLEVYVLTFQRAISLPDGAQLDRAVHVTMDEEGEIIKITSSK